MQGAGDFPSTGRTTRPAFAEIDPDTMDAERLQQLQQELELAEMRAAATTGMTPLPRCDLQLAALRCESPGGAHPCTQHGGGGAT